MPGRFTVLTLEPAGCGVAVKFVGVGSLSRRAPRAGGAADTSSGVSTFADEVMLVILLPIGAFGDIAVRAGATLPVAREHTSCGLLRGTPRPAVGVGGDGLTGVLSRDVAQEGRPTSSGRYRLRVGWKSRPRERVRA